MQTRGPSPRSSLTSMSTSVVCLLPAALQCSLSPHQLLPDSCPPPTPLFLTPITLPLLNYSPPCCGLSLPECPCDSKEFILGLEGGCLDHCGCCKKLQFPTNDCVKSEFACKHFLAFSCNQMMRGWVCSLWQWRAFFSDLADLCAVIECCVVPWPLGGTAKYSKTYG